MATADPSGRPEERTLALTRLATEMVLARTGPTLEALLLSGSHATGDAVWADIEGRARCLSDLDLYAVLPDERSCEASRQGRWTSEQSGRLAEAGAWGPVEVAYLTRPGLARMTARPGTITLRIAGRVLHGDASTLALVPDVSVADIDFEERLALLENRGAELLGGKPGSSGARPESRWLARHATFKVALDLAGLLTLEAGQWPARVRERVAIAERRLHERPMPVTPDEPADALPAVWRRAIAWRAAPSAPVAGQDSQEWLAVVRQWCRMWWRLVTPSHHPEAEPWSAIRAVAARAPWPSRLRRSIGFRPRAGRPEGRMGHLLLAAAGTPVHRLTGSLTTLLFAASTSPAEPVLSAGAARTLAALGVIDASDWQQAARASHDCWSRWVAGIDSEALR